MEGDKFRDRERGKEGGSGKKERKKLRIRERAIRSSGRDSEKET